MEDPYQMKAAAACYGPVRCQQIVGGSQQDNGATITRDITAKNGPLNAEVLV